MSWHFWLLIVFVYVVSILVLIFRYSFWLVGTWQEKTFQVFQFAIAPLVLIYGICMEIWYDVIKKGRFKR